MVTISAGWRGSAAVAACGRHVRDTGTATLACPWAAGQALTAAGQESAGLARNAVGAALDAAAEAHHARDYETAMHAACVAVDAMTVIARAHHLRSPGNASRG